MRRELDARRPDVEIRQLRDLQAAYAGEDAPEILVIGDSSMIWVASTEPEGRTLAQMLRDELPASLRIHALAGPGYNARISSVFLEALAGCPGRPRVVVLPTSLLMATTGWSTHPQFAYERESAELSRILREDDRTTRRLPRATTQDWHEWDRLPLPSLFGARRTMGEARLLTNTLNDPPAWAAPITPWQQAVRMRHMLDVRNAEKLTPESLGIGLLTQLGQQAHRLDVPTIAQISPVNRDALVSVFGESVLDHVTANTDLMAQTYLTAAGPHHRVLNAAFACPREDFGDPIHLNGSGRLHLAKLIAAEIELVLNGSTRRRDQRVDA